MNLKLVKVIDTHIHADHITGASKLKKIDCKNMMEKSIDELVELKVKDDEIIKIDLIKIKAIYSFKSHI